MNTASSGARRFSTKFNPNVSSSPVHSLRSFPTPYPLKHTTGLINGEWMESSTKKTTPIISPSDLETIAHVSNYGKKETDLAIEAAVKAFPSWASTTVNQRSQILAVIYRLIIENVDGLAVLLSSESGKPLEEAKGEIKYGADYFLWYSEEIKRFNGDVLQSPFPDRKMFVTHQPVGPCALLTPWNFPSAMPARKIAPALAAGCTSILRPAHNTPLSTLALAELMEKAGVPAGVVNVLTSDNHDETSGVLCASDEIRKVSFTGSTRVGRLLVKQSADTLKRMSMELGGRAPFIVFGDADVDVAVSGAMASKFRNAGQTCVCSNTMFVHANVYDEFVEKLTSKVKALKMGDGLIPGNNVGPLISDSAQKSIEAFVKDAVSRGANIVTGGSIPSPAEVNGLRGYFFQPTILTNVSLDSRCVTEEIFGPIAPIAKFTDEAEVIKTVNKSEVGLSAYIFSKDTSKIFKTVDALEVGMVGVNTGAISSVVAPFGGIKHSGFGREGSRLGLAEYMQTKYMMLAI